MTHGLTRRQLLLASCTTTAGPALASLGLGLPLAAAAQGTPSLWTSNRPVRVVVPGAAGSQTDLFARFVMDHLGKTFGMNFVVDNKAGASGTIGADAVAKAPADGHTLLFSNASFTAVLQAFNPPLPYDLLRDLKPVVQIGASGIFLAVAPDFPARDLKEFVELVRSRPDQYAYATFGIGSVGHLTMAALMAQQGLKMAHVPYKSGNEVVRDLLGGVVQIGWVDTSSSLASLRAGKIRALAVSGTNRVPATPDVPTMAEQGYPFNLNGWLGLFAPAGTPEGIVRAINRETNKLMHSPEGRERMAAMNAANAAINTPEQFAETLRNDIQAWSRIVAANGIKRDS